MPVYQYRCPVGHIIERTFTIEKRLSEIACQTHATTCPRQFTAAPIHFKGSGWGKS